MKDLNSLEQQGSAMDRDEPEGGSVTGIISNDMKNSNAKPLAALVRKP